MTRLKIKCFCTRGVGLALTVLAGLISGCDEAPAPPAAPVMSAPEAPSVPRPEGIVGDGAEWERVAQGFVYTDSPVALDGDEVLFAAPIQNRLYRIRADGELAVFDTETEHTMGLVRGADGYIYGCRNRGAQIVRYAPDGRRETLLQGEMTPLPDNPGAPGEFCNDVAVARDGRLWFTDRINRTVVLLEANGVSRVVASGFRGNGIVLSGDDTTLVVTDSEVPRLWAFAVAADGSLTEQPGFFDPVHTVSSLGNEAVAEGRPGTNGMTVDADGRYYVASFYGVQIYSPDGAYIGVIDKPKGFVSNLGFAGRNRDWLYATGTQGVWRLSMQVTGLIR